mmetsp:Transcript_9096/g.20068  ORF Transcript_9096/g.20068 Transcript_9096/m.20068 type:complete len:334 (-) Transcript_9096:145-1146(-)
MKCFPLIRGCGALKVVLGLVLGGVAFTFLSQSENQYLDCNEMNEACPPAYQNLVEQITASALATVPEGAVNVSIAAEVEAYCTCFMKCMNYVTVYEERQQAAELTNCYLYSQRAGVPSPPDNLRRLDTISGEIVRRLGDGGHSLPGMDNKQCQSCEDVAEHEEDIITKLGEIAAIAGLALIIMAGCECLELKTGSQVFAFCVLITDIICFLVLGVALIIASFGVATSQVACDPEAFRAVLEDAARDSTDGDPDHAAEFFNFLFKLTEHMWEGMCAEKPRFMVYSITAFIGCLASFFSFFITCCVCMRCTEDGMDAHPDDMRAAEMQNLMQGPE